MNKPAQEVLKGTPHPAPSSDADAGGVKLEGPIKSIDTALGQILEVDSSPELEKKVLLKIDLVYAISSFFHPGSGMANRIQLV